MASVQALVQDLARRGKAALGARISENRLRASNMRVEYKVPEPKTGVMRRVQLTPRSQLSELRKAESILVTPHS